MTKRFKLFVGKNYGVQTVDGEVIFDSIRSIADADVLVDLLNDLSEENEQLKSRVDYLGRKIERERNSTHKQYAKWEKEAEDKIKELSEENEQLKQFKEDVFNKIDMHLRILPTARDNEFNDDGDPSLYVGAIYMLETLRKELIE